MTVRCPKTTVLPRTCHRSTGRGITKDAAAAMRRVYRHRSAKYRAEKATKRDTVAPEGAGGDLNGSTRSFGIRARLLVSLLVCTLLLGRGAFAQRPAAGSSRKTVVCLAANPKLERRLRAIATEPTVARAHWGVLVSELNGQCRSALNPAQLFHPASTAKLITTAAAMALGPDRSVVTRLVVRGVLTSAQSAAAAQPAEGSVVEGEVVLEGAGDGTLADLEPLADAVLAAHVIEVKGDVVGDDTLFPWEPYPEDWAQDDLLWGYGAPVSALSVQDNQHLLRVVPGLTAGEPARVEPGPGRGTWWTVQADGLRTGAAGSGTHVGFGRVPGQPRTLRVWGTIAVDAPELREQLAIEDPAQFAAETLRGMLVARGIHVFGVARAEHRLPEATASLRSQVGAAAASAAGISADRGCGAPVNPPPPPPPAQVLAEVRSPTVAEDIVATNKRSLNLHAELLLLRLGLGSGAPPGGLGQGCSTPDTAHGAVGTPPADRTDQAPPVQADPSQGSPQASAGATAPVAASPQGATAGQIADGGGALVDPGSRAQGLAAVHAILAQAGVDADDVVQVDGSGLSTHDLVTPQAMVRLLLWARRQPWFAAWQASLPVAGVDGTLAARFPHGPVRGRLQAKTGTLGESRALTGYLRCASGRLVALSIMVDSHAPGAADRDAMDRMVEAIYRAE